jgi:glycine betaine/choline ABC-type transport system substrate-binding protein
VYEVAEELTVTLYTIWWFQNLEKVSKQAAQKLDGERFNLRKLNELGVRKQYQVEITNRIAASENLSDCEDIDRAWENIKENIKT